MISRIASGSSNNIPLCSLYKRGMTPQRSHSPQPHLPLVELSCLQSAISRSKTSFPMTFGHNPVEQESSLFFILIPSMFRIKTSIGNRFQCLFDVVNRIGRQVLYGEVFKSRAFFWFTICGGSLPLVTFKEQVNVEPSCNSMHCVDGFKA